MSLAGSPVGSSPSVASIGSATTVQFDAVFWNRLTGANKEMVDDAVDRVKASMEIIVDERMATLRSEFQTSMGLIAARMAVIEQQRDNDRAAGQRVPDGDGDGELWRWSVLLF